MLTPAIGAMLMMAMQTQPALPVPEGWESVQMPAGILPGWFASKTLAHGTVEGDRIAEADFLTIQTNPAGTSFYVVTRYAANCDKQQLKKLSDRVFNSASQMISDNPASAPWITAYQDHTPAEYAVWNTLCSARPAAN